MYTTRAVFLFLFSLFVVVITGPLLDVAESLELSEGVEGTKLAVSANSDVPINSDSFTTGAGDGSAIPIAVNKPSCSPKATKPSPGAVALQVWGSAPSRNQPPICIPEEPDQVIPPGPRRHLPPTPICPNGIRPMCCWTVTVPTPENAEEPLKVGDDCSYCTPNIFSFFFGFLPFGRDTCHLC